MAAGKSPDLFALRYFRLESTAKYNIAGYLGLTIETVSRTLTSWKARRDEVPTS